MTVNRTTGAFVAGLACTSLHLACVQEGERPASSTLAQSRCAGGAIYEAESMEHSVGGADTDGWNLWSTGHIATSHRFSASKVELRVVARGDPAAGVWPLMELHIGDALVGSAQVTSSTFTEYVFQYDSTPGLQTLRVSFLNDELTATEDRNLIIDKVLVGCELVVPDRGWYATGVPLRGINRAGLEYGEDWWCWNSQIYFDRPTKATIDREIAYFERTGMNLIRLPIAWERVQYTLGGPLVVPYLAYVTAYIDAATAAGFSVILDLHNYARYAVNTHASDGQQHPDCIRSKICTQHVLGDGTLTMSHLADVWTKLAGKYRDRPGVILGLMNEAHDFPMGATAWFAGVQQVIDAIRATGSTQLILVPNTRGSDVDHWFQSPGPNGGPSDAVAALSITDSADNLAFDMHAYLESPQPGAYARLVSGVTGWARTNRKRLLLSEFGVPSTQAGGASSIAELLSYLNANADVWLGWTPWDLEPYFLTAKEQNEADGPSMAWYRPFFTPNHLIVSYRAEL